MSAREHILGLKQAMAGDIIGQEEIVERLPLVFRAMATCSGRAC
ncbi:MAG: hypothetical protein OEU86_08765 [Gammaproteobacteria bacterium]|nr:hypothetical protein [Gammaproteobacteria bacterium]